MTSVKLVAANLLIILFTGSIWLWAAGENPTEVTKTPAKSGWDFEINVKDFGAVGDGKADDTAALQKAFDRADASACRIVLPPGVFRITKTLRLEKTNGRGVTITGQGGTPWRHWPKATTLRWDGEQGGTLLRTVGISGCSIQNLNFDGNKKAGILYLASTVLGWGNMLNTMSNVHFFNAKTGIQMGEDEGEHNNADYHFQFITFRSLETGFRVTNDQGVDFLFNYIFGLGVGTVLDFQRGGNLQVNTAQLTNCKLFLNIDGGGRNVGVYVANNVRIERSDAGKVGRDQLLRSNPKWRQANVKFVGFDDCQWNWNSNKTRARYIPLCEIGPGTTVSIESSIFAGPVAALKGEETAPANLVMHECSFSYVKPQDAVSANEYGYLKLQNNMTAQMKPLADVVKWPAIDPVVIPANSAHVAKSLLKPAVKKAPAPAKQ